jgi:hypothetical protein
METLKRTDDEQEKVRLRATLEHSITFEHADGKLREAGVSNPGKRTQWIAKLRPDLYNAKMSKPYEGRTRV